MSDATAVSAARTALHAALAPVVAGTPWRAHRTTPAQVVAPCVYVDTVEMSVDSGVGVGVIVATFAVVVVHDGTVRPQVEALDDMLARAWQAALEAGEPTSTRPVALDVGGPNLRAHVLRVDVPLVAVTLCAPQLVPSLAVGGART